MLELKFAESPQPTRDPTNRDYRMLALVLMCATRADLFADYVQGNDTPLHDIGLPQNLLDESRYLFKLPETQQAARQLQLVTQTLVELNDYCSISCPSNLILQQIAWLAAHQNTPLPAAGTEPR
jgi:hypothetical protein